MILRGWIATSNTDTRRVFIWARTEKHARTKACRVLESCATVTLAGSKRDMGIRGAVLTDGMPLDEDAK